MMRRIARIAANRVATITTSPVLAAAVPRKIAVSRRKRMPETGKQNRRMKGLIQVIKRAKLIGAILLTAMATAALGLPRVSGIAATVTAAA